MTARPLMVQGTMSGAGKSLLVAGLCRVLAQDGLRVAPFKSQNMALNSFVTADGREMGRAQVMQAEAAGIPPESAMNPILLKPTTDVGSQVIVNGTPIGTMSARDYFAYKRQLVPQIRAAYDSLAERFDVIVIEGAGSPAEINLKDDDIVNMGMARLVDAPVLLVGDIDRGGVFAQLYGTLMLLDADERARVKGTVVNKFRGDKTILDPGLDQLRALTGIPVAGVLPLIPLDLEDEDSLSDRFAARRSGALVDIAVIRLPRISNFTDFMALDAIEQAGVRYVSRPDDLGQPDLIVLPGTKSTLADLRWLRESGLEAAILKAAAAGTVVFGICGGFQMLGAHVSDPHGMEGGGELRGLGLLPLRTVFSSEKRQVQVSGTLPELGGPLAGLSGARFEGYEIHMGATDVIPPEEVPGEPVPGAGVPAGGFENSRSADSPSPLASARALRCSSMDDFDIGVHRVSQSAPASATPGSAGSAGEPAANNFSNFTSGAPAPGTGSPGTSSGGIDSFEAGVVVRCGNVYGTYVHGIFDTAECSGALVKALLERKGIDGAQVSGIDLRAYKQREYDKLADMVRANMDMDLVYRILEEGA